MPFLISLPFNFKVGVSKLFSNEKKVLIELKYNFSFGKLEYFEIILLILVSKIYKESKDFNIKCLLFKFNIELKFILDIFICIFLIIFLFDKSIIIKFLFDKLSKYKYAYSLLKLLLIIQPLIIFPSFIISLNCCKSFFDLKKFLILEFFLYLFLIFLYCILLKN